MIHKDNIRNKPKLTSGAKDIISNRFIPYKFVQYLNGLYNKTNPENGGKKEIEGYSCAKFYEYFRKEVYPNDELRLQTGITEILKDNLVYSIFDDIPKSVKDYCKPDAKGNLPNIDFSIIAKAYGLVRK